jgi:drug/metabolite transporter (DMT)-like permease
VDGLWIPVTIAAAGFQALRTSLQKYLTGRVSTIASTFTRFAFGLPFALLWLLALTLGRGVPMPAPDRDFFLIVAVGAVGQILATALLLHVVTLRNVAVGVAFSKAEIILTAIFGFVVLGDALTVWAVLAIVIGTLGVMVTSMKTSDRPLAALLGGIGERTALLGLVSGSLFGVSAVAFRAASTGLGHPDVLVSAAYALAWATAIQTGVMAAWLWARERDQFARLRAAWRPSLAAGIAGVAGSACWFTAMTIQTVAIVRTLGLVELLFTFAMSVLWFRERPTKAEVAGVVMLVAAIVLLLNPPR